MKTTAFNWKYLKYLFWLGPILILMGITAGLVSNSWGIVPLGLAIAGVAVLIAWLAIESSNSGFFGRRSTQAGTNALIATVAVVVILGLLNFLAVRHISRIDLTENQLFTLASQSQQVVRDLQTPVKVWLFDIAPNPIDRDLLENYRRENSQFSYEYVDPQAQPGVAREFGVQSVGEVYVEAGEQRRFVQAINQEERLSERRLTNGLAQISSDRQLKVYLVQGHGERSLEAGQGGLSQLIGRMGEENYLTQPLNLAEATRVPDDASVVVVAGPQRPLLPSEIRALDEYLDRRSGLMLLADPQTNPELGALLDEWGVQLSDRLIVDPAGEAAGLGAAVTLVTQYGQSPITQGLGNGISFYPIARPLQIEPTDGVTVEPLLLTSDRTQAQRLGENGQLQFDPATDPQGTLTLGAALSRPVSAESSASPSPSPSPTESPAADEEQTADEETAADEEPDSPPEARLVVIGNSSFVTDGLFNQQLNGDVFLNSVSWLSQQDDQALAIRPKEATNRRIFMQPQQQLVVALVALVFLPILGFGMGVGVWWRRR